MIFERARRDPNGLALDDGEQRRSWAELEERVHRLTHLLRDDLSLAPGDHAALLMGNRGEVGSFSFSIIKRMASSLNPNTLFINFL